MKKIMPLLAIVLILVSCNPKKNWEKKTILNKENGLMASVKKGKVDTAGINSLLQSYQDYADAYPDDTAGAEYLLKAADFYRYMHKPQTSIAIYEKVYGRYATFSKRPFALFLQGFIYENEVGNLDSARARYTKFLDTYPNHVMAKDVKITLDNLGKSPEEMMNSFTQKTDSAVHATK
ncbi:MAG TPA: tetratricopeptide repeat protein [Chitinophagales bacterium]|nr:tetratricopeptide repeat protein [Chitinophagales bacterium]